MLWQCYDNDNGSMKQWHWSIVTHTTLKKHRTLKSCFTSKKGCSTQENCIKACNQLMAQCTRHTQLDCQSLPDASYGWRDSPAIVYRGLLPSVYSSFPPIFIACFIVNVCSIIHIMFAAWDITKLCILYVHCCPWIVVYDMHPQCIVI